MSIGTKMLITSQLDTDAELFMILSLCELTQYQ